MPDTIGRISVPEQTAVTTFPLRTDFTHGRAQKRNVVVHQFGDLSGKLEQRFFVGPSAPRYTFRRTSLRNSERKALLAFWESQLGSQGAFFYAVPQEDQSFVTKTVYFEDQPLTFDSLTDAITSVGLTFVEIPDPTTAPQYAVNATVTRFPSGGLETSLLEQVQELIPLVHIRVREAAVDDIYVADRRVTLGTQLYLPRLLRLGENDNGALIEQTIEGGSDNVQFLFGNADRVMIDLANDTELKNATIEFSLFHVSTGIKLDLWAGQILDWASDQGPEFSVQASDIISALTLQSPVGNVSRTCWRIYADATYGCPVDKNVDTRDLVHFPNSTMASCDLGYDTPNGCLAHVVAKTSFPGCLARPQGVTIRDNQTKSLVTPTSQINDSIFGQPLPEIWHNDDGIPQRGMSVACQIAAGREESDFYVALGIVGRGPIGAYTVARMYDSDGDGIAETFLGSTLDGQPHHGFKQTDSNGSYTDSTFGLRQVLGNDPADNFFSLGRVAGTPTSWRELIAGSSVFEEDYSAGVAFMEIRRTDQKGIQPSAVSSHQMTAMISQGLTGRVWTGPGSVSNVGGLTNPFWVCVNTLLRSLGVQATLAATQEAYFDVEAAVQCGDIADATVQALFGGGTEKQFRFKGTLDTIKPLRDRLQEILNNCLGFYSFSFGKLRLGCRANATASTFFSAGNMLWGSLKLEPIKPRFEKFTVKFADEEYLFQKNTADYTDQDYAFRNNRVQNPRTGEMGLIGSATKSESSRLAVVRTREELGGVGVEEQKKARIATWKSTILALDTEAGQNVGILDPDVPDGRGKFRIQSWRLNRDYSIDFKGQTVTDSMYDLTVGTTTVDVGITKQPHGVLLDQGPPPEPIFLAQIAPDDLSAAEVYSLSFASTIDTRTITSGTFTFTFHDPATPATVLTKVFSTAFSFDFFTFPYSAAELAWVLKAHLPGMNVTQIAGYVTNVYGDSPVHTITVNLQLAGSPKSFEPIDHEFLYAFDAATGTFSARQVLDSDLGFSDITTGNASTDEHGFLPKLSGSLIDFLNGQGAWATSRGASGIPQLADSTGDFTPRNLGAFDAVGNIMDSGSPAFNPGAGFGSLYEQVPVGVMNSTNVDFYTDFIPLTFKNLAGEDEVWMMLQVNGIDQDPYFHFHCFLGTNHFVMRFAPKASDKEMVVRYFRGIPAYTPPPPGVPGPTPPPPAPPPGGISGCSSGTVTTLAGGGLHPYWRLAILSNADDGHGGDIGDVAVAAEIEFHTVVGGPDIATAGQAIAGNSIFSFPSDAFDDDLTTNWATNVPVGTSTCWIGQHFDAPVSIVEFAFTNDNNLGFPDQYLSFSPTRINLDWSDDGSAWTTGWLFSLLRACWVGPGQTMIFTTDSSGAPPPPPPVPTATLVIWGDYAGTANGVPAVSYSLDGGLTWVGGDGTLPGDAGMQI